MYYQIYILVFTQAFLDFFLVWLIFWDILITLSYYYIDLSYLFFVYSSESFHLPVLFPTYYLVIRMRIISYFISI